VAEIEEPDGFYTCERCGKVKPVASTCTCGGKGHGEGEPMVPEGWDPEITRAARPRLSIVRPPERGE
jgi:hypothetical protein